jgi:hypothetical protein
MIGCFAFGLPLLVTGMALGSPSHGQGPHDAGYVLDALGGTLVGIASLILVYGFFRYWNRNVINPMIQTVRTATTPVPTIEQLSTQFFYEKERWPNPNELAFLRAMQDDLRHQRNEAAVWSAVGLGMLWDINRHARGEQR